MKCLNAREPSKSIMMKVLAKGEKTELRQTIVEPHNVKGLKVCGEMAHSSISKYSIVQSNETRVRDVDKSPDGGAR